LGKYVLRKNGFNDEGTNVMMHQRDAFIESVTLKAFKNKNIMFLSADFGAPALDKFRDQLPKQFLHMGISEQNLIDTAIGLALKDKTVFCYAMAPFISLRAAEQHKLAAMMKLPIINLFAGVGFGYANAGPTHYSTEDLAICLNTVGASVYTVSDSKLSGILAEELCVRPRQSFVRLDRDPRENLQYEAPIDVNAGYRSFFQGTDTLIISHGVMVGKIYDALKSETVLSKKVSLVDLFCCKPLPEKLLTFAKGFGKIIIVDEQLRNSSLCSHLSISLLQQGLHNISNFYLDDNYAFENHGRDLLMKNNGLDLNNILSSI
jgi:transketolase